MKKILLLQILILLTSQLAWAFDLDMTVDDDIRKNYNSSKLVKDTHTEDNEETLPALPEISKYKEAEVTTTPEVYNPPPVLKQGNVKIHAGSTFEVVNSAKISDWQQKGTTVRFAVKTPIINIATKAVITLFVFTSAAFLLRK